MKKILSFIILFLLFASISSAADLNTKLAAGPGFMGFMGSSGTTTKDMCTAASDASLLCEDFEGAADCGNDTLARTNCRVAYTVAEGGTSVFDAATAHAVTFHCSTSTKSVLISRGDTNISGYYTISSSDTIYVLFYIKPVTFVTNTNTTGVSFNNSGTVEAYLTVGSTVGGQDWIRGAHRNQSNTLVTDTLTNVTEGTWYKVEMKWIRNQASAGWSITIDGVVKTGADTSTMDSPITRAYLGNLTGTQSYELDNIKVHTSAPACAD